MIYHQTDQDFFHLLFSISLIDKIDAVIDNHCFEIRVVLWNQISNCSTFSDKHSKMYERPSLKEISNEEEKSFTSQRVKSIKSSDCDLNKIAILNTD